MFRRMSDALTSLRHETQNTLSLLEAIPDPVAGQAVGEGHRDLRRMAWHLVETRLEMPSRLGIILPGHDLLAGGFIAAPPATMTEVRDTFARTSEALLEALAAWDDATLEQEDELYGERWMRGQTLFILIAHEIHHRGQMTVLMRQAGLVPPSLYGPAKEGWAAYGLEAPQV